MNIAAGSDPQAALQCRSQVGNDVAKHVVGHNYVEPAWITDHLHAKRVYVHMLGLDLRVLQRNLFENPLPQAVTVRHYIRLVAHEHARAAVTRMPPPFRVLMSSCTATSSGVPCLKTPPTST